MEKDDRKDKQIPGWLCRPWTVRWKNPGLEGTQDPPNTERQLHARHNNSPFFDDVNRSRKGTYLATRISRLYWEYRKGERKDDRMTTGYLGIHARQAGKIDGPFRTANPRISLALGHAAGSCARSDLA